MMRPPFTDALEAARVSRFIEAGQVGRWRLVPFTKSEEEYERQQTLLPLTERDDPDTLAMKLRRLVPPGDYISLWRRRTATELETLRKAEGLSRDLWQPYIESVAPDDPVLWRPVMSDTPAEIEEHQHAIIHASGDVLIHGLGLGVLVSALLAKPDVRHIDVVEIDPEVIALTGRYYSSDPRVRIWRGDCMHKHWPKGKRWDYVWHDIWSDISSRNLRAEEAEHGISYGMLFKRFEDRADMQGAWAYSDARRMEEIEEREHEAEEVWNMRFWASDTDTRVAMLVERQVRSQARIPDGAPTPDGLIAMMEGHFNLTEQYRQIVTAPDFSREDFEARRDAPQPLGRPNEER